MLIFLLSFFMSSFTFSQSCQYEFDLKKTVVEGTGYKFTQKEAVSARFSGFKINQEGQKKDNAKDLLKDLEVTVDLMTIDSGNSLRDQNLRETLFSGIFGDSIATINVKSVTADQIETLLKINEKSLPVTFTYKIKDQMIEALGSFDALDFALTEQIAALKKRCGSLHTGSDGKAKTWTDFKLSVKAALKKNCEKK